MQILSIGVEEKLFEKGSRVYNRIRQYANEKEISEYHNFVFTRKTNVSSFQDGNFFVHPICGKNKIFQIVKLFKQVSQFKNKKDIFITSQDSFEIGLISFMVAKFLRTKLGVQVHIDFFSPYFKAESFRQNLQSKIAGFVLQRADTVRVVSKKIEKYLTDVLKIDSNKIINLPVHVPIKFTGNQEMEKENVVLSISRFVPQKNINRLVKAFEIFKIKNPNYILKIFGSGPQLKEIEKLVALSKFSNDIKIFPWTDNPFLEMRKAKVFCISSDYEGWGMTAVESVSVGTPVVMTPVGCANEFIFDQINGFVSKDFSVQEFANAMEKSIQHNFDNKQMEESLKVLLSEEQYLEKLKKCYVL